MFGGVYRSPQAHVFEIRTAIPTHSPVAEQITVAEGTEYRYRTGIVPLRTALERTSAVTVVSSQIVLGWSVRIVRVVLKLLSIR